MRALLLSLLIPSLAAAAPDKPPREPRCLAVEPASLRTSLAKPIPGARLTVLIPAREDDLGIVHLSKEEFAATGLSWDKFRRDAEAAAARHLRSLTPSIEKNEAGEPLYATLRSKSHLTASVFFCKEFHAQFRKPFGDQLLIKKTLKACGNNFWPKSSTICEKVSKSFIFIVKVFWATFLIDRHWATFYTIQLVTLPLTQTLCVPQYEQCERIFIKRISITD